VDDQLERGEDNMPKLHFVNGYVLEVPEEEYLNLMRRLTHANMKYWVKKSTGDLVFMTSPSMALLERELPDGSDDEKETVPEAPAEVAEPKDDTENVREKETEDPAVTALREVTEKSECLKSGHAGQNQIIFKQMLSTKSGPSERYFSVCEFCGFKSRFIAKDKLTEDIREAAKLYEG
jgi:DNA-directed RNA polymerase subunit M/transcription elongation factor TFIIS